MLEWLRYVRNSITQTITVVNNCKSELSRRQLKRILRRYHVAQHMLASQLGVTQGFLSLWYSGRRNSDTVARRVLLLVAEIERLKASGNALRGKQLLLAACRAQKGNA